MSNIVFANPQAFWLLFLIPIAVALYFFRKKRMYATMHLSSFLFLPKQSVWSRLCRHIPFALELVAMIMLIIVIARPQNKNSWQNNLIEGIDLVMILDTSGSMEAVDLTPNRFEAAKKVAAEMIANRPNDNIGLVAFAGESFTQCPTTTDHITLLNLLNELNTRMMEDGTAIGLGIATGINTLRESKTKSKVMILLTDGSNNSGDITPTVAAQIAKEKGIRIYTVAVGTHGKAQYPIETSLGIRYVEQEVTIDEATLRSIAQTTGGAYYRATDNRSLEEIYRKIDSLEKTKLTTKSFSAYEELYRPWALCAFLLLLLAYILRNTLIRTNP